MVKKIRLPLSKTKEESNRNLCQEILIDNILEEITLKKLKGSAVDTKIFLIVPQLGLNFQRKTISMAVKLTIELYQRA